MVTAAECRHVLSWAQEHLSLSCSAHHTAVTFSYKFQMFLMPADHKKQMIAHCSRVVQFAGSTTIFKEDV
jgi:hypothetical protein